MVHLIGGLALPSFILIVASWRVAKLRSLTVDNFQEKVDESVSNTLKEQLSERQVTPLFNANNVVLPPGKRSYDVVDALVPGDNVGLLAEMYHDLSQLGIDSNTYQLLLQTVNALWGGG